MSGFEGTDFDIKTKPTISKDFIKLKEKNHFFTHYHQIIFDPTIQTAPALSQLQTELRPAA